MKRTSLIALAAMVLLLAEVTAAHAHVRTHFWVGPVFGPTLWWGSPYYYSTPRTVIIDRSPTVYLQPAEGTAHWYYCKETKSYYPYVKQCPDGWTKVAPTPPEEGE